MAEQCEGSICLRAGEWFLGRYYVADVAGGSAVLIDVHNEPDFGHLKNRAAMRGQSIQAERRKDARNNRRPHLRKD